MDKLFLQVIKMSVTSSYVILFVIVVRLLLKKAPKVVSYVLWLVVLFRLICPFSFESIFSFVPAAVTPAGVQTIPPIMIYSQVSPQLQNGGITAANQALQAAGGIPLSTTAVHNSAGVNPLQTWLIWGETIWLFGIAVLLTYSIFTAIKLSLRLKPAKHIFGNVYEIEEVKIPFVFGAIRPKVYLPTGLSEKEKSYIIKHEHTHIQRFDHLIKPFAFLVLCVHWFNPFVWLAFSLMNKDMELSCDESVIKQLGNGIKKDYSLSLLALATGRRATPGGCPLAFGEGDPKGRIKNVLNYKKPTFWIVIAAIIVVMAISVGLLSNPPKKQLTVEDYANQFIAERIKTYEGMHWKDQYIKIVDSRITKLEKMASFDNLLSSPVEIWDFEYRLQPDKYIDVMPMGVPTDNGWITETADDLGKPMLIFSGEGLEPQYLGYIHWGAFADFSTPATQETALREFLERRELLLPETYHSEHIVVKFPLTTGETCQLFLSQPATQGGHGIWCVERWMDGNGTVIYVMPDTDGLMADYYIELQEEAEQGHKPGLLDPLQVAINFIKKDLGQWQVTFDDLIPHYAAAVEDFLETPESHFIGFISNFKNSDKPYFHLDQIEWLTLDDTGRLEELNIDPAQDMPNGFYIHNPHQDSTYCEVTKQTQYYIINWGENVTHRSVTKEEFIRHLEQYQDFVPPFRIITKDGYVQSIREQYVP